jgi:hypothetical protein
MGIEYKHTNLMKGLNMMELIYKANTNKEQNVCWWCDKTINKAYVTYEGAAKDESFCNPECARSHYDAYHIPIN